jgi:hypothetical protein
MLVGQFKHNHWLIFAEAFLHKAMNFIEGLMGCNHDGGEPARAASPSNTVSVFEDGIQVTVSGGIKVTLKDHQHQDFSFAVSMVM